MCSDVSGKDSLFLIHILSCSLQSRFCPCPAPSPPLVKVTCDLTPKPNGDLPLGPVPPYPSAVCWFLWQSSPCCPLTFLCHLHVLFLHTWLVIYTCQTSPSHVFSCQLFSHVHQMLLSCQCLHEYVQRTPQLSKASRPKSNYLQAATYVLSCCPIGSFFCHPVCHMFSKVGFILNSFLSNNHTWLLRFVNVTFSMVFIPSPPPHPC